MRISMPGIAGAFTCFSPSIRDGYASIGAGGVNGRDDISIQMDILSRAGTYTCRVPSLDIDFQENHILWSAYRVRNAQFGGCTITQTYSGPGHKLPWKGHATIELVIVKGNTTTGSPSKLHTEKNKLGKPITRRVEVDWMFDQLFTSSQDSSPAKNHE
jgi:hypothetical protein